MAIPFRESTLENLDFNKVKQTAELFRPGESLSIDEYKQEAKDLLEDLYNLQEPFQTVRSDNFMAIFDKGKYEILFVAYWASRGPVRLLTEEMKQAMREKGANI